MRQGLVQNSSLPLALAEVTAALAENLERHLPSIEEAEPEHAVYAELVDRLKPAADELRVAGGLMAAQARRGRAAWAAGGRAPEHEQMLAAMPRA